MPSGALFQEIQYARLELPVAGGPHVVAADDVEDLRAADMARELGGRADPIVLGADRNQDWRADLLEPLGRDRLALCAHTGGECAEVAPCPLGEQAVVFSGGIAGD